MQLTDILNQPPKEIGKGPPQRVAGSATPRVGVPANFTADLTNPEKVRAARLVCGRRTRANPNPIESKPLPKNLEDARQTKPANAPSSRLHQSWPKRKVNAQQIGGKKNNMRHASLKRLQKLIDVQKLTMRD